VKLNIPAYAISDKELWSPELVRNALVQAFKVERALPGGGMGQSLTLGLEISDAWRYADDEKQNRARFRPNAAEISQMETLLIGRGKRSALVNGAVLGYREQRAVLLKWALWVSYGGCSPDGVPETDEEFARRMKVAENTMKRMRDHAAGIMAHQANVDGIVVWHAGRPERRRKVRGNLHAASN
jgi:hypothetical protein